MSGARPGTDCPTDWMRPHWATDGVAAVMTTRNGGVSQAPFDSFNLRVGLGDDAQAVAENHARLQACIGARPVWIEQVHGARVVHLQIEDAEPGAPVHRADASVSSVAGVACMVQVADCLPVLFSAAGRAVAAAHAGWRGLSSGILFVTARAVAKAGNCPIDQVEAWLGPCIGPARFEVGTDVVQAFGCDSAFGLPRFVERGAAHPGKWLADLPGLAEDCLRAVGIVHIQTVRRCTAEDDSHFFSYRRDRLTGRMAAGIWLV